MKAATSEIVSQTPAQPMMKFYEFAFWSRAYLIPEVAYLPNKRSDIPGNQGAEQFP